MKQKRYWLRGGLILNAIVLILGFAFSFIKGIGSLVALGIPGAFFVYYGFCDVFTPNDWCGQHLSQYSAWALAIIFSLIFYFLVGSIFGLLYGTIKRLFSKQS